MMGVIKYSPISIYRYHMCVHECPVIKCIILVNPPPELLKYVSIRHIGKPKISKANAILFTYLLDLKTMLLKS